MPKHLAAACLAWPFVAWIAARALLLPPDCARSPAILVLAGSSSYRERADHAARLFSAGVSDKILLTQDGTRGGWDPVREDNPLFVELASRRLAERGVPPGSIEVLPRPVSSTRDEAVVAREYVERHALPSLTVVTSPYHTRRTRWAFRRELRHHGVLVHICGTPTGTGEPSAYVWWLSSDGWREIGGEYAKGVWYLLTPRGSAAP